MMSEERDMINEVPGSSPEFHTELAEQLAELVPEAVADGKIDVEKLKELLGGDVADTSERFGLFWPGKKRAMRAAQTPTTATLRPDKENSKDWDTTKNVFIEGDNLEVLKILQKHYHGKIKMIYIDPPYNTGKDFVYPDNYKEGLETYLEWSKQVNEDGKKLSSNSETEGRYHSNWLNMMYPRLKLARNLLTNDGVIFISIDDHEVAQLRRIMDEIFGEANFIEGYIWESNFRPDNSSRIERENAQHILCYARNKRHIKALTGTEKATEGLPSLTKNSMKPSTLSLEPEWVDMLIPDGHYAPGEKAGGGVRIRRCPICTKWHRTEHLPDYRKNDLVTGLS
ncbi:site-specific DNA-methyltransferase [Corynebacterium belfantii]|uniref:site-specific DNA-methyltransferase n=1 Tax=Corynebacterium belfantii TaxID=2014537 RepID=UPI00248C57C1|nr:site-specific DNA-methyltransferase [Corynebacterium belfantii]